MKYKNLTIIGTSHIAPESLREVEKVILDEKPGLVALELDRKRLAALLSKKVGRPSIKDIRRVGLKGWLFAVIGGWVERKLGQKVGVNPGAEMLRAFHIAQSVGAKVALIDQDIEITLRRFSKALTWKEKGRLVVDLFKGLLFRPKIKLDLRKVPSEKLIKKLMSEVKKRYPNIYRVLVLERNDYMAHKLAILLQRFPDEQIVAVIGAGHEREIVTLLKKYLKAEQLNRHKKR